MSMETVTLDTVYAQLLKLSRDVAQVKTLLQEDYALADDVVQEIEISRHRPRKEFISHETMKEEFG